MESKIIQHVQRWIHHYRLISQSLKRHAVDGWIRKLLKGILFKTNTTHTMVSCWVCRSHSVSTLDMNVRLVVLRFVAYDIVDA